MTKTTKCTTCSKGWCQNHTFELTPKEKDLLLRKTLKIRLCPYLNKNSKKFCKLIPIPNKDKTKYTPLFLLEEEIDFYRTNGEKLMHNHLQNLNQNQSGTSQMLIPKHGRNQNYCTVCEEDYQDYLTHIEEFDHKRNVNGNKWTAYMREMECRYRKLRKKQSPHKIVEAKVQSEQTNCPQNGGENMMGLSFLLKSNSYQTL